jgi:hypothetical protein
VSRRGGNMTSRDNDVGMPPDTPQDRVSSIGSRRVHAVLRPGRLALGFVFDDSLMIDLVS